MYFLRLFCFLIFFIAKMLLLKMTKNLFLSLKILTSQAITFRVNDSTNVMIATGNVVITSDSRKITA